MMKKITVLAAVTSLLLATSSVYAQESAADAAAKGSGPMTTSMSKSPAHRSMSGMENSKKIHHMKMRHHHHHHMKMDNRM